MRYLVLVMLLLTGCASTPDAGWYGQGFWMYDLNDGLPACSEENSGIRLGYEKRIAPGWKIAGEYEHISHLLCGRPFNNKFETSVDHIGIVVTYGGID